MSTEEELKKVLNLPVLDRIESTRALLEKTARESWDTAKGHGLTYARTDDREYKRMALVAEAHAGGITQTLDSLKDVWSLLGDLGDLCRIDALCVDEETMWMRRLNAHFQDLHNMREDEEFLSGLAEHLDMSSSDTDELLDGMAEYVRKTVLEAGRKRQERKKKKESQ